jgi:hypothetical protein
MNVCDLRYNEAIILWIEEIQLQSVADAARPMNGCNVCHVSSTRQSAALRTHKVGGGCGLALDVQWKSSVRSYSVIIPVRVYCMQRTGRLDAMSSVLAWWGKARELFI